MAGPKTQACFRSGTRAMGRGTRVYVGKLSSRVRERDLDYEFGRCSQPRPPAPFFPPSPGPAGPAAPPPGRTAALRTACHAQVLVQGQCG